MIRIMHVAAASDCVAKGNVIITIVTWTIKVFFYDRVIQPYLLRRLESCKGM